MSDPARRIRSSVYFEARGQCHACECTDRIVCFTVEVGSSVHPIGLCGCCLGVLSRALAATRETE